MICLYIELKLERKDDYASQPLKKIKKSSPMYKSISKTKEKSQPEFRKHCKLELTIVISSKIEKNNPFHAAYHNE